MMLLKVSGLVSESEDFVPLWRCRARRRTRRGGGDGANHFCPVGGGCDKFLTSVGVGNESDILCVSAEINLAERAFHRKCPCNKSWSPQCTFGKVSFCTNISSCYCMTVYFTYFNEIINDYYYCCLEKCWHYTEMISAAGALAGAGLAIDSSVVVVASMLVSPLMGPIIWMVFGTLFSVKEFGFFNWKIIKSSHTTRSGKCGCIHFLPGRKVFTLTVTYFLTLY